MTMSTINNQIRNARERKGWTDVFTAEKVGLSIHEYDDVEAYEDEVRNVLSLATLRRLCAALDLDLYELFSISPTPPYPGGRATLVKDRRQILGLSTEEVGDKVGFYGHVIEEMEQNEEFLESWCLDDILELAKVLGVPPASFLGHF